MGSFKHWLGMFAVVAVSLFVINSVPQLKALLKQA